MKVFKINHDGYHKHYYLFGVRILVKNVYSKVQKLCKHDNIKSINGVDGYICCRCYKKFKKPPFPDYINVPHKNFF